MGKKRRPGAPRERGRKDQYYYAQVEKEEKRGIAGAVKVEKQWGNGERNGRRGAEKTKFYFEGGFWQVKRGERSRTDGGTT